MPRAGGFVRYPNYTHGSLVGFLIGFFCLLAYSAVIATEVEAVRGYVVHWLPILEGANGGPSLVGWLFQLGLIIIFFLLNYWSVNVFGKTNTVITIIKFVVPGLVIIFLLQHLHFSNFTAGGANPGGTKGIFAAVTSSGIAYSFNGFRNPIEFAGEAQRPQRDVPLAIILSVLVGLLIYLLLQVAFIGATPAKMLSHGWGHVHFDSPWAGLVSVIGIGWLLNLILIDSFVSPSATANIYFSATARSLFAWARNGTFYNIFQRVSPNGGVPRPALWLTFFMAIIWMTPARFQNWSDIIAASTSAKAFTFVVGPVSLIALRRAAPELKRPFLLKGARIMAPLAFIAATFIIYWSGWTVVSLLVPVIIPAIIFYFAFVDKDPKFEGKVKGDVYSGLWFIGYFIFILVISFVGSYGSDSGRWIPAPWDTFVAAIGSLVFYYWGVYTALEKPRLEEDSDE
jgi:amino acid transporter